MIRAGLVLLLLLGLAATAAAQTNTLAWVDNATNEAGVLIERAFDPAGPWAEIARVGVDVTAYVDTGVTVGTFYCYRVAAFNAAGPSAYSNVACRTVTSGPATTVPAAPTSLTVGP
ncbi:MAG: fibronectin type III domain-containing protein [Dehalococcoidia bacterium]|nr:fibronectin type III domain-containing protein [Dehalococcoidia bacterium]